MGLCPRRMLSRTLMSYGLLDGHDVRNANVAQPFPIAYVCKIYGGIFLNVVVSHEHR